MDLNLSEKLKNDAFYLVLSLFLVILIAGAHNIYTPDESVNVGMVEVETKCAGLNIGFCVGIQKRDHKTYNYDNYKKPEPGSPNYYRRVESELMARAYTVCSENTTGMEWTSKVSYLNRTGSEWAEMEEIELLPCESTFWRDLK